MWLLEKIYKQKYDSVSLFSVFISCHGSPIVAKVVRLFPQQFPSNFLNISRE